MVWKPKEKPLTPEEAIQLARRELAPRWAGTPPLLAAIRQGENVSAFPLDPQFARHAWLLLFVDPLTCSGEASLELIREWHQRYSTYSLGFIVVLQSTYSFTRLPEFLASQSARHPFPYSVTLDSDDLLAASFRVTDRPKAILIGPGRPPTEASGPTWFSGLETTMQKFLRERDPGLPLLPEYTVPGAIAALDKKVELGLKQGVRVTSDGRGVIALRKPIPARFKPGEFFITGTWTQTDERIETSDPEAAIGFHSLTSQVSLIAQAMVTTAEITHAAVEVNGIAAYDIFAGPQLIPAEDGRSVVALGKAGLYHVLRELPENERDIVFKFPFAKSCPVGVYGFRLSGR